MAEIIMPQLASTVPAFLAKLWKMVDDPDTDNLITWGDTGDSFVIMHQAAFSENLLPYYYKHSNLASFVRQLNMYGFNKRTGVDTGGLKSEKDQELEYSHPYFRRGQGFLLQDIKTKKVIIMAYIEKTYLPILLFLSRSLYSFRSDVGVHRWNNRVSFYISAMRRTECKFHSCWRYMKRISFH